MLRKRERKINGEILKEGEKYWQREKLRETKIESESKVKGDREILR